MYMDEIYRVSQIVKYLEILPVKLPLKCEFSKSTINLQGNGVLALLFASKLTKIWPFRDSKNQEGNSEYYM